VGKGVVHGFSSKLYRLSALRTNAQVTNSVVQRGHRVCSREVVDIAPKSIGCGLIKS
jgi:hypothetical protein